MNIKNLNEAIVLIAEKKNKKSNYAETDTEYTVLEDEIESLQSDLKVSYGSYLEEVLFNIYDEYCPDNDVQPIGSYITHEGLLEHGHGVAVEADDFPGTKVRLALIPDPVRFVVVGGKEVFREVIWSANTYSKT